MARESTALKDDELLLDGDDVLDFADYDPNAPRVDLTPHSYEEEVDQLKRDLLAAAEHLEYEAWVLRQQYALINASERPRWYH